MNTEAGQRLLWRGPGASLCRAGTWTRGSFIKEDTKGAHGSFIGLVGQLSSISLVSI